MRRHRNFPVLMVVTALVMTAAAVAQQPHTDYPKFDKPLWQRHTIRARNEIIGNRDGNSYWVNTKTYTTPARFAANTPFI